MNPRQSAEAAPADTCACALDAFRAGLPKSAPVAVAYSGGLDSTALLHLVHAYTQPRGIPLFAFHVHHGLSAEADGWLAHCERECARLGIPFAYRRVHLADTSKHGVEAAARHARYAALGELCRANDVHLLLTAHHRDDQAETLLLQLLRGAGPAGLAGMESLHTAPGLLGDPDILLGRPLLALGRAQLASWVAAHRLSHVDDDTNSDPRYARNALRLHVMPVLARYFPGFEQRLVRSGGHARSASRLLDALARQDLEDCRNGDALDSERLGRLDSDRIDNLLRFWLAEAGVRTPSASWLSQLRTQLLGARDDAQVRVVHPDCEIRRHRNRICLIPRQSADLPGKLPPFRWDGQAALHFPRYHGTLHFDRGQHGIAADWLRGQTLQFGLRGGGETLKPASNRPTRSLKHHYQALGIPPWERERLPLLWSDAGLLFAAGIGMNWRVLEAGDGECITLRWAFDDVPSR